MEWSRPSDRPKRWVTDRPSSREFGPVSQEMAWIMFIGDQDRYPRVMDTRGEHETVGSPIPVMPWANGERLNTWSGRMRMTPTLRQLIPT